MDFDFSDDEDNNNNNNNNNTEIERIAIPPPQQYSSAYNPNTEDPKSYEDEEGNVKNFWREWRQGDKILLPDGREAIILRAKQEYGKSEQTTWMGPRSFNWRFVLYVFDDDHQEWQNSTFRKGGSHRLEERIRAKINEHSIDINYADEGANEQNVLFIDHISLDLISVPFLDYGNQTKAMTRDEVEADRKRLEVYYANEENYFSDDDNNSEPPARKKPRKKKLYKSDLKF